MEEDVINDVCSKYTLDEDRQRALDEYQETFNEDIQKGFQILKSFFPHLWKSLNFDKNIEKPSETKMRRQSKADFSLSNIKQKKKKQND